MHQTFSQHSVGVTSEAETRVLAYHFGGLHVSNFDFCGKIYIQEVICVKDLGVVCLQCFLILVAVCSIAMRMRRFQFYQTHRDLSNDIKHE